MRLLKGPVTHVDALWPFREVVDLSQVNVDWMRENDVVKHLLRANLHQKQYVDQARFSSWCLGS